jgi:tetratricopeptide (TPR) repeat protein
MATALPETETRSPDLAIARIHLRLGSLSLARAELEALAGQDALDVDGLLDLAEARWRTGDLPGAGDAAQAYLASGGESAVGYVIAAEAVGAVGRPGEARRLAAEAMERTNTSLDAIFAGMPRSLIWPADVTDAGGPAGTLFAGAPAVAAEPSERETPPVAPIEEPPVEAEAPDGAPSLWEEAPPATTTPVVLPEPAAELEAGRAALDAGDIEIAALHLGIALRLAPALAPAVLDAVASAPGDPSPPLELVRGDAYRLVGHETDARRSYATAAALTASSKEAERTDAPA